LKLSTYIGLGTKRSQDQADVVKLIQANELPLEFPVDAPVQEVYCAIWDGLYASGQPR
jgi:hypothetical protein